MTTLSGESMEPMEEVPLKGLHESKLERSVYGSYDLLYVE